MLNLNVSSLKVLRVALHEQADDKTKQSKDSSKDLNGKDFDESIIVSMPKVVLVYSFRETHSAGSAASARAALLPLMPTQTPQIRLHIPTVRPAQNNAYPVKMLDAE